MSFIDSILNLAALLLWFNWRSLRFDPLLTRRPVTLAGTLKSTHSRKPMTWMFLAAIPLLLLIRGFLYWQIGSPADWTPKQHLGLVVVAFQIDSFAGAMVFSLVSFIRFSMVAFFWMLVLVMLTRKLQDPDPILRLMRLQLGRVARWPLYIQLLLPVTLTVGLWAALRPLLVLVGAVGATHSSAQVVQQGFLLYGVLLMSLKFVLPVLLLLYMLSSYVYLGSSPMWDFAANASRGILSPIQHDKLRSSKLDFAPLVAVIIIFLLLHTLPALALNFAELHKLTVWPE